MDLFHKGTLSVVLTMALSSVLQCAMTQSLKRLKLKVIAN